MYTLRTTNEMHLSRTSDDCCDVKNIKHSTYHTKLSNKHKLLHRSNTAQSSSIDDRPNFSCENHVYDYNNCKEISVNAENIERELRKIHFYEIKVTVFDKFKIYFLSFKTVELYMNIITTYNL